MLLESWGTEARKQPKYKIICKHEPSFNFWLPCCRQRLHLWKSVISLLIAPWVKAVRPYFLFSPRPSRQNVQSERPKPQDLVEAARWKKVLSLCLLRHFDTFHRILLWASKGQWLEKIFVTLLNIASSFRSFTIPSYQCKKKMIFRRVNLINYTEDNLSLWHSKSLPVDVVFLKS